MLCGRDLLPVIRSARYILRRSLTKAALIPLIKRIHPDLYLRHGEEVSATNKRCVQNLYELAEFLRLTDREEAEGKQKGRLSPLRASYCMDFYMESEKQADGLKERISTEIKPNKALCEPSILRNNKLDIALQNLKMQLGQVYTKAGLLDPLKRKSGMDWGKSGVRRGRSRVERGIGGIDVAEIDRVIYERVISRRHTADPVHSSKSSRSRMEMEAEAFLRSGSVLLQNMSPIDEVQALDRLRKFLVDYGTVVNLSSTNKRNALHLVIRDSVDTKSADNYKIVVAPEKNRAVIKIPKDFRTERLLKTLAMLE